MRHPRIGSIAFLLGPLALLATLGPLTASAATRSMTGSLGILYPALSPKLFDTGPAVAGQPIGPYPPTTGSQTVQVAGSTTGTFAGRTVTLPANKLNQVGGYFLDFPAIPPVAQLLKDFRSVQNPMTFMVGGGALAGCPGPGCTEGGGGSRIDWCPPFVPNAVNPAPGTTMNRVGNWDCINRAFAGPGNRDARIRITNSNGAPHFGGTLNLLRRQSSNVWRVRLAPSTPMANDAEVTRSWRTLSWPAVAGGENFNFLAVPQHRGPRIKARLNARGAVEQTLGCVNGLGTVGIGKTYPGLPGPSGPFVPILGPGNNCQTSPMTNGPFPDQFWGFRMTTGTISGSVAFPPQKITTALGTPFAPVVQPRTFNQGFFFTRMGRDEVVGTVRNLVLVGGAIAVEPNSGNAFFQVSDLRMKLPEPAAGAGLMAGIAAVFGLAVRRSRVH